MRNRGVGRGIQRRAIKKSTNALSCSRKLGNAPLKLMFRIGAIRKTFVFPPVNSHSGKRKSYHELEIEKQ